MPNIPCLVQTEYSFIDIAPMVAPLEYITDFDAITYSGTYPFNIPRLQSAVRRVKIASF